MQPPDRVLASAVRPRAAQCHLTSEPPTTRPQPHTAAGTSQHFTGQKLNHTNMYVCCVAFIDIIVD